MRTFAGISITLFGLISFVPNVGAADVTIGAMAELTGSFAPNGQQCRKGYELAEKLLLKNRPSNAPKIRVVYGDNRGDANAGVNEFKRLVESERAVAVVTTRSQVAMPLNPISKREGVPLVATIGHPEFIKSNPFSLRVWPNVDAVARFSVQWLQELRKRRLAIISVQDEFTIALAQKLSREFAAQGGTIVLDVEVIPSETDFSSIVTKLRATTPDVVFVNLALPQIGPMIRRIREQGSNVPILTNSWASYPEVIQSAGKAAIEGAIFVDFEFETPRFLELAKTESPENSPVAVTYSCYLGLAILLVTAIDSENELSSSAFRERLFKRTRFLLPDTEVEIRDREAVLQLVKRSFRNGVAR